MSDLGASGVDAHEIEWNPSMTKSEPSAAQRLRYLECGQQVEAGLEQAVRILRSLGSRSGNPVEAVRRNVRAQRLEAERARVHADLLESLTGKSGPRALGDAARAEIAELSASLLGWSAASVRVDELVAAAHRLLDRWRGAEGTRADGVEILPGSGDAPRVQEG